MTWPIHHRFLLVTGNLSKPALTQWLRLKLPEYNTFEYGDPEIHSFQAKFPRKRV